MFEKGPIPVQEKTKEKFPNVDAELSKYLERVDFGKLKEIFSEFIAGLGADPQRITTRFIDNPEDFEKENAATKYALAGRNVGKHTIMINWERFKELFERFKDISNFTENAEKIKEQFVVKILCHEESHAVTAFEKVITPGFFNAKARAKTGYETMSVEVKMLFQRKIEIIHFSFNEAVTDYIGGEIFEKYMHERGEKIFPLVYNDLGAPAYLEEKRTLHAIVDKICKECGIENHVLLKVIYRGYFEGEDISGEKIDRLFKNVFPEDFERKLAKWKGNDFVGKGEIYKMLNESEWKDEDRKRIRRWAMSIFHTMPNS